MVGYNKDNLGDNYGRNELDVLVASDLHDELIEDENGNLYFAKHKTIADTAEKYNIKLTNINGDLLDEDDIINYLSQEIEQSLDNYVNSVLSEEDKALAQITMLAEQEGIEKIKKQAEKSSNTRRQMQLQYLISLYEKADDKTKKDILQKNMKAITKASEFYKDDIAKVEKDLSIHYNFLARKIAEAYFDYSGEVALVEGNHSPVVDRLCKYDKKFIDLSKLDKPLTIGDFKFAGTPNFTEGDDEGILFPKIGNVHLKKLYENMELDTVNQKLVTKFMFDNRAEIKSQVDKTMEQNKQILDMFKQHSEEEYNKIVQNIEQQVIQSMVQKLISEKSNVYNRLKNQDFNIFCTHNPADNDNTRIYEIDKNTNQFIKDKSGKLKIKNKEVGQSSLGVTALLQEKRPGVNLCGHIHSAEMGEDFLRTAPDKFAIINLKNKESDEGKRVFIDSYRTFNFKKAS